MTLLGREMSVDRRGDGIRNKSGDNPWSVDDDDGLIQLIFNV